MTLDFRYSENMFIRETNHSIILYSNLDRLANDATIGLCENLIFTVVLATNIKI